MDDNDLIEQIFFLELITDHGRINPNTSKILKGLPHVYGLIVEQTSFLDRHHSIKERLVCLLNGYKRIPLCIQCGTPVKFNSNKKRYNNFCSSRCSYTSEHRNNKIQRTLKKKPLTSIPTM